MEKQQCGEDRQRWDELLLQVMIQKSLSKLRHERQEHVPIPGLQGESSRPWEETVHWLRQAESTEAWCGGSTVSTVIREGGSTSIGGVRYIFSLNRSLKPLGDFLKGNVP